MTFCTVLRLVDRFCIDIENELICIDEESASVTGTTAALAEGDYLTVEQLFYGLMLPSGNDAAHCLAQYFGSLLLNAKTVSARVSGPIEAAPRQNLPTQY